MIIDKDGLQLDSFSEIFDSFTEQFKAIYGEDINLDQDTPDGQQIGIYTNMIYDLQTQIARLYNALDPDLAEGHELDKILKLIASVRLPATKSTVDLEITANKSVYLDENYTVRDDNKIEWIISTPQSISSGTTTVSFEAKEWGSISAMPNSITTPVTILTEIDTVNNPNPAVEGRDEESDVALRKRRNQLIGYRATSLISSIVGKILNLESVNDCILYENKTSLYDTERELPAHSIWIIVDGGDIDKIAEIIATDKTIGCGLKGLVEATHTETFIRGDGTERIFYHEVRFDRPMETEIFIKLNVKKRHPSDVIDVYSIKRKLAELNFNIAQNITVTELYSTIYSVGSNFIASDLELSLDDDVYVDDLLVSNYDERLIIVGDNITITEI